MQKEQSVLQQHVIEDQNELIDRVNTKKREKLDLTPEEKRVQELLKFDVFGGLTDPERYKQLDITLPRAKLSKKARKKRGLK